METFKWETLSAPLTLASFLHIREPRAKQEGGSFLQLAILLSHSPGLRPFALSHCTVYSCGPQKDLVPEELPFRQGRREAKGGKSNGVVQMCGRSSLITKGKVRRVLMCWLTLESRTDITLDSVVVGTGSPAKLPPQNRQVQQLKTFKARLKSINVEFICCLGFEPMGIRLGSFSAQSWGSDTFHLTKQIKKTQISVFQCDSRIWSSRQVTKHCMICNKKTWELAALHQWMRAQ